MTSGQRILPSPKPRLTHFLCFPLHNASTQLTHSLAALQADIETNELVSVSAIRPVATMHLTLGVMSLTTPTLLQRAKEFVETGVDFAQLLRSLSPMETEPGPLLTDLQGLDAMGMQKNASVLYAIPRDPSGRLEAFAMAVRGEFEKEGLITPEERAMKLHVTVVNTIYSRGGRREGWGGGSSRGRGRGRGGGGGSGGRGRERERETFDAVDLVRKYEDVVFASGVRLDKVAVCRMGELKAEDGTSQGYLVCGEGSF